MEDKERGTKETRRERKLFAFQMRKRKKTQSVICLLLLFLLLFSSLLPFSLLFSNAALFYIFTSLISVRAV